MKLNRFKSINTLFKLIVVCIITLCIACFMSGCFKTETQVENLMKITDDFVGERVVTLVFDKYFTQDSGKQDRLEEIIKEACPQNLTYRTEVKNDLYQCVFVMSFSSLDEYRTKTASLIGRQIAVAYGYTDSVLSKGTFYKEDYDGMELIKWLEEYLYESGEKNIQLSTVSTSNVVQYNSEVFSSKTSTLNTSTVKGKPVHSVTIDTVNHKNTTYNRTLTLTLAKDVYNSLGEDIKTLMTSRVGKGGKANWQEKEGYMNFSVEYKKITADRLQEYTKLFLDCKNTSVYYGDKNQSSTPLAEQLVFQEKINLLSFVSGTKDNVILNYNYTLPKETTHGEGVELNNGEWATSGYWSNNTYKISDNNGVYDIRVPDGMQYLIKGIDINLTAMGNENFERAVDFVYDRNTGEKGLNYAYNFLAGKGFTVSKESGTDGLVCRVIQKGTADQLNNTVGELFGSGNSFTATSHTNDLSVVTDIAVTDNVNISHMLTGANANVDIDYVINSKCNESIRNVNVINKLTKVTVETQTNKDLSYSFTANGGNFQMDYSATVPYYDGVILYCIICGTILLIVMATLILLARYNHKLKETDKEYLEEENNNDDNSDDENDYTKENSNVNNHTYSKALNNFDNFDDFDDDYMKKYYGY